MIQHPGVRRWIDTEPDDVAELDSEAPGHWTAWRGRLLCGCKPCLRQMRCTELALMSFSPWPFAPAVHCVVTQGGLSRVRLPTRCSVATPSSVIAKDGSCRAAAQTPPGQEPLVPASDRHLGSSSPAHTLLRAAAPRSQQDEE